MSDNNITQVSVQVNDGLPFASSPTPAVSWKIRSASDAWKQNAYEILFTSGDEENSQTTGKIVSDESIFLAWPFQPLKSRQQGVLKVRVWDQNNAVSPWSEPVQVEAPLFEPADWKGVFIRPGWTEDTSIPQPGPLLRKEFSLSKTVRQARLYATALGVYELRLNGKPVSDQIMAPGWTSYHHRLRYQSYDVTRLIHQGLNAIGIMLGDGWFRGRLNFNGGSRNIYGKRIAALVQLEIAFTDGTHQVIASDASWRAIQGPILENDIYNGEIFDARKVIEGWDLPGMDTKGWEKVRKVKWDPAALFPAMEPPVRPLMELEPVRIFTSPSGKTLVDFGQNLVGRVAIQLNGQPDARITLRHAEVLENGELGTRPLRGAKATDTYISAGRKKETWHPRFTFHGFRYVEVEGWPGKLRKNHIKAQVCHSDMNRTGWFECSSPLLNRLHENVVWSMRGNFFYIPTDCPQRDERLGWTGDIQVFSPTASFLYDCRGFLSSWLNDLAEEQEQFGFVPFVVPNTLGDKLPPAAAWGDAAVVVPWVLYQRFGDIGILKKQFDSMRAWLDLIHKTAGKGLLWDTGFQFGDWLDPDAPPDNPAQARTPSFIVATAYFAWSADLTSRAAKILGYAQESEFYLRLATEIRHAFQKTYVTPAGMVIGDASTAYSLALQFALLADDAQRKQAARRLAELVRQSQHHISTGFVGTPLICDALTSAGYVEDAWQLVTQTSVPSWLYPVTMGATSIWERWDSMLPDGRINPGEMTSFNHYALGAVADWLHRTAAGLAPLEPGYRKVSIAPQPGGGLTWAKASHESPYGRITVSWEIIGDEFRIHVTLPPNTTGQVVLPDNKTPKMIASGTHRFTAKLPPGA